MDRTLGFPNLNAHRQMDRIVLMPRLIEMPEPSVDPAL
jgi:hypothetical protein